MTVPDLTCQQLVELVTDYLEGALSPAATTRFEEHLASCDGCRSYLEQMQVTLRVMGSIPADSLEGAARERLLTAFRGWSAEHPH
jgi:anti-sigma factor RsiW